MRKKLSEDAFEIYRSLGPGRSYEAIAQRFGVGKRAVVRLAVKEDWQGRLRGVETKENQEEVKRLHETRADVKSRQHKLIREMQGKALEALKNAPLKTGMDAVRTLDVCFRQERELYDASGPLGEGEGGTTFTEAQETSTRSMLEKWIRELPSWQLHIFAVASHWGPDDPRSSKKICDLVESLCGWLAGVVTEAKLPPADPFHVLVLHALSLEKDPAQRKQMTEVIFELERELKAYLVRQGIRDDDRRQWITGHLPPGARSLDDALEWGEIYGSDHRDPVSFIAARIRKARVREASARLLLPRAVGGEPRAASGGVASGCRGPESRGSSSA